MPNSRLRHLLVQTAPAALGIAVLMSIVAPKGTAWWFPLLGGVALASVDFRNFPVRLTDSTAGLIGGLIATYVFVSLAWTADWRETSSTALLFSLYLAAAWYAVKGLLADTDAPIRKLGIAFLTGLIAGAVFIGVELLNGNELQKLIFTHMPFLRPASPEHVGMVNGAVGFWAADELNRGVAVLNFLVWPALGLVVRENGEIATWLAGTAILLLIALATFSSQHDASKLALVCAAATFALSLVSARWAGKFVAAGWVAACLAVVPLAHAAYNSGTQHAQWLPDNARARIIIWAATAEKVRQHPVLGIGAGSTPAVHKATKSAAEQRPGDLLPWSTGVHSHNVFLQFWYELGAAGVCLLLSLGLALLALIGRMPSGIQPFALAAFVSVSAVNAFSWSLWYPWLLASIFFTVFAVVLANTFQQRLRAAA